MSLTRSGAYAFIFILFGSLSFCPANTPANDIEQVQGLSDVKLEALARLPEEQIDIGRVALILTTEAFPDLDVARYSAQLDARAADIRRLTGDATDPDYRIRVMNTYLYLDQGFHFDQDDMYAKLLKNRYLNGILDTKSGSCTTMPLLYLAVAQRLDYPVYPVAAPQHLFLRYVDPQLQQQNIEATSGGGSPSNQDYTEDMEVPEAGIKSGVYLATMTYRQLLGDLIAENGTYWAKQKQLYRAIKYFKLGLRLNPKAAEVYCMLGQAYRELASQARQQDAALEWLRQTPNITFIRQQHQGEAKTFQQTGDDAMEMAQMMGVAPPTPRNYWVRQEQLAKVRAIRLAKEAKKRP